MYNIAICDDDKNFISYLNRILLTANEHDNLEYKVYEFFSGEELVYNLEKGIYYDLLILDMCLNGMDGDEAARLFRKQFPDSVLVFCSGVRPPTIKSFKATPFRYILKEQSDAEFVYVMKEVLNEVKRNSEEPFIVGHYRSAIIKVKLKSILYIETSKRGGRVIVCSNSKEMNFEEKILVDKKPEELYKELRKFGFALAQSSCLVNMNHIELIRVNDFTFDSGEVLCISRAYQKSFKEEFVRRFSNKYS